MPAKDAKQREKGELLKTFRGRKLFFKQPFVNIRDEMSFWEVKRGGWIYYCQILEDRIIVGSNDGSKESDNAGGCSLEDFLSGKYQDIIRQDMSEEVLREVIAEVGEMVRANK